MDKLSRGLLTVAIAILFPVLIYFTANTFLPNKTSTQPREYDCGSVDLSYNSNCYDMVEHSTYRGGDDEERGVMRAGLAMSLALVGIVGALGLRKIRELLLGLTVGGGLTVFGAVSYLTTVHDPSSEPVYQFVFWMAVFAFLALLTIVYTADHSLPRPVVVPRPAEPKKTV